MAKTSLGEQLQKVRAQTEADVERFAMAMAFREWVYADGRRQVDVEGFWEHFDRNRSVYLNTARSFYRVLNTAAERGNHGQRTG